MVHGVPAVVGLDDLTVFVDQDVHGHGGELRNRHRHRDVPAQHRFQRRQRCPQRGQHQSGHGLRDPILSECLVVFIRNYDEFGLMLAHPLGEVRNLRIEDTDHDYFIGELVPPLHYPVNSDVAERARGEPEEGQDNSPPLHGGHIERGAVDGWQ